MLFTVTDGDSVPIVIAGSDIPLQFSRIFFRAVVAVPALIATWMLLLSFFSNSKYFWK